MSWGTPRLNAPPSRAVKDFSSWFDPSALWMEASADLTLRCIHNAGKISALETQLKCRNSRRQTGRCHQRADRLLRGKKLHHILSFTSHLLTLTWKLMSLLTHNSCTKTESELRVLKNKKLLQSSAAAPTGARRATWRIDKNDLSFPLQLGVEYNKDECLFLIAPDCRKKTLRRGGFFSTESLLDGEGINASSITSSA